MRAAPLVTGALQSAIASCRSFGNGGCRRGCIASSQSSWQRPAEQRTCVTSSTRGLSPRQDAATPIMRLKKGGKNKAVAKADLPSKICVVCNRPFTWRKKWEKCWDDVKYCSERCRRSKGSAPADSGSGGES